MVKISMRQTGIAEAKGKIKEMRRRILDLKPVLKIGARDIETLMANRFEREEDPAGKPWAPLAESTIEARVRRGAAAKKRTKKGALTKGAEKIRAARRATGGIKKLVISARLKNSLFARAYSTAIVFGSNVVYLSYHQEGTTDKEENPVIPPRAIVPVEKRGSTWALIRRGPAGAVFDAIEKSIKDYVKNA